MPEQDSFFQEVDPNMGNQFFQEQANKPQAPVTDPVSVGQPANGQRGQILLEPGELPPNRGVRENEEVIDPSQQQAQETEPGGPAPRQLPDHMSPEHAYGMATYQQSRADKAQAEIARLREEMEAFKTANPIAAYVASDPGVLQQVLSSMNGHSTSGAATNGAALAGGNQQTDLKKPEPPQRPAELEPYSEEAIAYQTALIDYQAKLADYNQAQFDAQVNRLQQAERQRQLELQQQQQIAQMKQEAMYQHQLTSQEADEFIQFASSPESLSNMGLWINAFRLSKGTTNGKAQTQQQRGDATAADLVRNRQLPPQTATASPGAPGVNTNQQDSFFQPLAGPVDLWAPARTH